MSDMAFPDTPRIDARDKVRELRGGLDETGAPTGTPA